MTSTNRRLASLPILARCVGLVITALLGAASLYWWLKEESIELTVGVHSYEVQGDMPHAFLMLSNAGTAHLAVPLRLECQVDQGDASTNYLVETPYTVFLRPGELAELTHKVYAIPLPRGAQVWRLKTKVREQTAREQCVNTLSLLRIGDQRTLSRLLGSPSKAPKFHWKECLIGPLSLPSNLPLNETKGQP